MSSDLDKSFKNTQGKNAKVAQDSVQESNAEVKLILSEVDNVAVKEEERTTDDDEGLGLGDFLGIPDVASPDGGQVLHIICAAV